MHIADGKQCHERGNEGHHRQHRRGQRICTQRNIDTKRSCYRLVQALASRREAGKLWNVGVFNYRPRPQLDGKLEACIRILRVSWLYFSDQHKTTEQ